MNVTFDAGFFKNANNIPQNSLGVLLTTMTMRVSPYPALTSTSTGYASIPFTAAEQTFESMAGSLRKRRANATAILSSHFGQG